MEESRGENALQFIDIYYKDLISDPIGTVKTLYDKCGLTVSKEFEYRLQTYLEDQAELRRQRKKRGSSHNYTLKNFGLTKEAVRNHFEEYLEVHGMHL